jgi:hypothetical protein
LEDHHTAPDAGYSIYDFTQDTIEITIGAISLISCGSKKILTAIHEAT